MNPECRAGKHSNCDGQGWREDLGHIGPCLCGCHEKTRPQVVKVAPPTFVRQENWHGEDGWGDP